MRAILEEAVHTYVEDALRETPRNAERLLNRRAPWWVGTSLFNGAVAAGPNTGTSFASNLTNADHFFDKGTLTFMSGANAGLARAVQTYLNAAGTCSFAFGFPVAPSPGDAFQAVRGCLLTLADCEAQRATLDAQEHFRGQPFTPPAIQGAL